MFWDKIEKRNLDDEMKKYTWEQLFQKGYDNIPEKELKETTYFKCIKYISESVAKCPIILKQDTKNGEIEAKKHSLYEKLRLRPNPNMTAIDCIKSVVALGEHYGIGGLLIDRKTNDLYPAQITNLIIDNKGILSSNMRNKILVEFKLANEEGSCFDKDMIIYRPGISFDGINTKANKDLLKNIIRTNIKGQDYLGKLFDNGLTNKVLVQLSSDIKDEKELKKIQKKFDRLYSNNGRTFTVPAGYNISSLNLSLADAQFEQIRKLSRREIANCFGLSPSQIGDLEDSNNNNMEMQSLGFLTDTLLIKFQQLEQEFDWKYISKSDREKGLKCRFNQNVMLRTNAETQAKIVTEYIKNSGYTVNDVRRILGKPLFEGGDELLVSSGVYKYKDLSEITRFKGGGKNENRE